MSKEDELNKKLKAENAAKEAAEEGEADRAAEFNAIHDQVLADIQEWTRGLEGVSVVSRRYSAPQGEGMAKGVSIFEATITRHGSKVPFVVKGTHHHRLVFKDSAERAVMIVYRKPKAHDLNVWVAPAVPAKRGQIPKPPQVEHRSWNKDEFLSLLEAWMDS